MEKQLKKFGIVFCFLFIVYSILSYLIFLRDDFLLERFAYLTQAPWLLEKGRVLAKTLHVNSLPTPLFFLTLTLMFAVYTKALLLVKGKSTGQSTANVVKRIAIAIATTTFFSFPALSTDVFDYISSNRVLFVHHANPWLEPPQNFPEDEFIYLGSWKFRASVYGPVQFIFSSLVHPVAGDNIIANIIGFKLVASLFTIALICLVSKWLKQFAPKNYGYGLLLISWNPLLLIEVIGNAHNDIIMAFFAFLGFYWLSQNRIVGAATGFAFGVLAKVAAGLYVPVISVWLAVKEGKKQAFKFAAAFTLTSLVGLLTLGEGMLGFIKNLGVQLGLYLRSLPTIIRFIFLEFGASENQALLAEKLFTLPPFLILFAAITKRVSRTGVIPAMVAAMLVYLFLVAPMLQPWYLIWVLPFAALLPPSRLQSSVLVFSYTSLIYYPVLFSSFYFDPTNFAWQIVMFALVVIPPLIVWFSPKYWYTSMKNTRIKD